MKLIVLIPLLLILSDIAYSQNTESNKFNTPGTEVLWWEDEYSEKYDFDIPQLKLNTEFINSANSKVRHILTYLATISGSQCKRDKSINNEVGCKLTQALGIKEQCGQQHLQIIKQELEKNDTVLKDLETCYQQPGTATYQGNFDNLNILETSKQVKAYYKLGKFACYKAVFGIESPKITLQKRSEISCTSKREILDKELINERFRNSILDIARSAQGYFAKPKMLGGGGRSFKEITFSDINYDVKDLSEDKRIAISEEGLFILFSSNESSLTILAYPKNKNNGQLDLSLRNIDEKTGIEVLVRKKKIEFYKN